MNVVYALFPLILSTAYLAVAWLRKASLQTMLVLIGIEVFLLLATFLWAILRGSKDKRFRSALRELASEHANVKIKFANVIHRPIAEELLGAFEAAGSG